MQKEEANQLFSKYIDRNYSGQFKELTKEFSKKFNFQFIDLEKSYPTNKNPIFFYSKHFGHHNELGYEIMSKYLASIIKNR